MNGVAGSDGGQRVDGGGRLAVERQAGNRADTGPFDVGRGHRVGRLVVVEHRAAAHFLPVVVLGIDPEDRHGGHAVRGGDVAGQLDGGNRLVQRVERPAEEPGLLAGEHGHGGRSFEGGGGLERGGRSPPGGQLRGRASPQAPGWRGARRAPGR